jgi:hypothetical protein
MKPHIWFRLDSRAFCLGCDAEKREALIGQSCPGMRPDTEPLHAPLGLREITLPRLD